MHILLHNAPSLTTTIMAILIIIPNLLTTIPHSLLHYQPQCITITAIMMIMKKLLTTILIIT